jgi:hypothetical protein
VGGAVRGAGGRRVDAAGRESQPRAQDATEWRAERRPTERRVHLSWCRERYQPPPRIRNADNTFRLFGKDSQYVYYHCTGAKAPCGNSYIREEDLGLLFGDIVKRVRIPTELADAVAKVLRESQSDKESFVRTTTMCLQQQQLAIRWKLDRAYDDRLSGRIPDDLWTSKSAELEEELPRVRAEMAQHERASHDYERIRSNRRDC